MMEEEDCYDNEDESDIIPLLSTENSIPVANNVTKRKISTKRVSFDLMTQDVPDVYNPTRKKCLAVVLCLAGMFLVWSLVGLGWSRTNNDIHSLSKVMSGETCLHRFNMTYDTLLLQVAGQESFCTTESQKCKCNSPFIPIMGPDSEQFQSRWNETFEQNKAIANRLREQIYDVVFFGDSITERWNGNELGVPSQLLSSTHEVFKKFFDKKNGGKVDGIALGIGGDRCPQLLYRLRNGELADALQAKVFWILIGTNDHGGDHCSGDTIVAGNIQIVQEILAQRPNAIVVLNSILPRANPGSDLYSNDNSRQWQTLTRVNQWLECYANENERVEFFNATDIFLQPSTTLTIPEYYSDPVHPSAAGHSQWATGIVGKLLDLIQS